MVMTARFISNELKVVCSYVNCSSVDTSVRTGLYFLRRISSDSPALVSAAVPVDQQRSNVHPSLKQAGLFKKWSMLGVHLSSNGCTREVGRAREKRLRGTRQSRVLL